MGVITADPPSDARAGAWLLASAPESCLNTTACPRRGHDRGRRTGSAAGILDLGWSDTTLPAFWLRIGVSCHADGARGGRICHADRSAGTRHRKFDESLRHSNDTPVGNEQIGGDFSSCQMTFASCDVVGKYFASRCVQRYESRLAKLGVPDRQHRRLKIQVLKLQTARFAET